jgi:hypothetical protein
MATQLVAQIFYLPNGEICSYQASCRVGFQTLMIMKLKGSEDDQLTVLPFGKV